MTVPVPLDSLVGRRHELARLTDLRRTSRLITLRGPGGAGKTRLALEYAGQARGAYWVELAPLTDASLLESATAAAIGVPEQPGRRPVDTIASALAGRHALLVLDNCEHLIEASARLVSALLARCADLTVLATSREDLDVPGEAVLRLGPLSLRNAIRLFAERASAAARGFVLSDANTDVVARICERLDGHPLSIELAARRVRLLGADDVLRRLDDRFRLLASSRPAEERHRDLRTAIGWSYDLLDDEEKAVFRRLSVFPGGFGLDAASAVGDPSTVLDFVGALEAKSLLVAAGGRFRMQESIRLFAHDRLVESGEVDEVRQRVVEWLGGLAERYARQAFPTLDVLGPLDVERDNLFAALEWAHERRPLFAAALAACWRERGQFGAGRALLEEPTGPFRSTVLAQAAVLATDVGDGARAVRLASDAVALDRDGDPVHLVRSLSRLAGASLAAGDASAAVVAAREALALARPQRQPFATAVCLHNLAYISLHAGSLDEAETLLAECLPACRAAPEPWLKAGALHSAGAVALARNDLDAADAYFREALECATSHVARKIHSIEGLAVVAARRGDAPRAVRLSSATSALRRQWGMSTNTRDSDVSSAIRTARAALSGSEVQRAHDEGAALSADDLVAHALAVASGPLTPREHEVVQLVVDGRSTRQIAAELDIAERTVEAHLENVRGKLDVRSRAELAAWWARQAGLPRGRSLPFGSGGAGSRSPG
ncbi:tetratricopeptide repeat protein [Lentzea tibetensis]|uniref:Tetratricopeptide repeat protein n=1 Tax=Lentzea tibetensis TaxID=2591470 RepID=A0A563F471_9PSEU|nr:LuxR C-terminal-related transcriptional regulator [Lentzea tibetensis]TWP54164.1 tetratricopeptide repeat protein [Lentzea tibetensis]